MEGSKSSGRKYIGRIAGREIEYITPTPGGGGRRIAKCVPVRYGERVMLSTNNTNGASASQHGKEQGQGERLPSCVHAFMPCLPSSVAW